MGPCRGLDRPAGRAAGTADALLLWQTMVGAWPLELARCLAYMEKAVREAAAPHHLD